MDPGSDEQVFDAKAVTLLGIPSFYSAYSPVKVHAVRQPGMTQVVEFLPLM